MQALLFFLVNGNIALILDTEWEHQAEAFVRGDPSETLFLGFFSPFFIFLPFFMQLNIYIYRISCPPVFFSNRFSLLSLFALLPTLKYLALYSMLVRV